MNENKDGKKHLTSAGYSLLFCEEYSLHHSNQRGVNTVRRAF